MGKLLELLKSKTKKAEIQKINDENFDSYFNNEYMRDQLKELVFYYARHKTLDTIYYEDYRNEVINEISNILYKELTGELEAIHISNKIPDHIKQSSSVERFYTLIDSIIQEDEDIEKGTNTLNDIFTQLVESRYQEIEDDDNNEYQDMARSGYIMTGDEEDRLIKENIGIADGSTINEYLVYKPIEDKSPEERNFIEVIDTKMIEAKENSE